MCNVKHKGTFLIDCAVSQIGKYRFVSIPTTILYLYYILTSDHVLGYLIYPLSNLLTYLWLSHYLPPSLSAVLISVSLALFMQDIEMTIHCAEWLCIVGGSSAGELRKR